MKIPKTFLPEKGLDNKLNQLIEKPKTHEKEPETTTKNTELEKLLKEFDNYWVDFGGIYLGVRKLLTRTDYKQIKNEKFGYEYWVKPIGDGENYLLTIIGKKYILTMPKPEEKRNQHYMFSRIKDENIERFCKNLEHQRKMVYPKSISLTGLALSWPLMVTYVCSYYPKDTFLKDFLSWAIPATLTGLIILSIPTIVRYVRGRIGKGLEKYCIGMIRSDDKEALRAAFT